MYGAQGGDVVKVTVGEDDLGNLQPQAACLAQDEVGIAAGINDGGLVGLRAAHQIAIGAQAAHGEHVEDQSGLLISDCRFQIADCN